MWKWKPERRAGTWTGAWHALAWGRTSWRLRGRRGSRGRCRASAPPQVSSASSSSWLLSSFPISFQWYRMTLFAWNVFEESLTVEWAWASYADRGRKTKTKSAERHVKTSPCHETVKMARISPKVNFISIDLFCCHLIWKEAESWKHQTDPFSSPSGDLGIGLVWDNHPPTPTTRNFSVRLMKFSSNWTKSSMMGPRLFSGWYQMLLDVP